MIDDREEEHGVLSNEVLAAAAQRIRRCWQRLCWTPGAPADLRITATDTTSIISLRYGFLLSL